MAVCEFGILTGLLLHTENGTAENSWRYASLAMNRGALKRGFTVYIKLMQEFDSDQ